MGVSLPNIEIVRLDLYCLETNLQCLNLYASILIAGFGTKTGTHLPDAVFI